MVRGWVKTSRILPPGPEGLTATVDAGKLHPDHNLQSIQQLSQPVESSSSHVHNSSKLESQVIRACIFVCTCIVWLLEDSHLKVCVELEGRTSPLKGCASLCSCNVATSLKLLPTLEATRRL
jgi:hypothetical protein